MPLRAIPRAAPHMEVPLYHMEKVSMAQKPEITKKGIAPALLQACPSSWGASVMLPAKTANRGTRTRVLTIPEVHWRIVMPISESINAVPWPATAREVLNPSLSLTQ